MDMMRPCVIAIALILIGCDEVPSKEGTLVDVRMPDGSVIRDVPDGTTQAELLGKLDAGGYDTSDMVNSASNGKVLYAMRGLNRRTYTISGPPGKTRDEIRAAILARAPEAGMPSDNGNHQTSDVALRRSAQRIGNTTFYSDGTTAQRVGNSTYYSDGTTAQRVGNSTYYSDGTTAQRVGNSTYYSDGTTAQRVGNSTYYSDGTVCQTVGSNTFC